MITLFCRTSLLVVFICFVFQIQGQDYPMPEQNNYCLSCHEKQLYKLYNEDSSMVRLKPMCISHVIDRKAYESMAHRMFLCTDCHSGGYEEFPHSLDLRFEIFYSCLDCHGGVKKTAQYNFETIDEEYRKSIHFENFGDLFTCWKCHEPHSYKPMARKSGRIDSVVQFDNMMCLSCHADMNTFRLLSQSQLVNVNEKHSWLPNQKLHFNKVRCLECHAALNDSISVAHHILPKEKAVKKCVECHSKESKLMASLYTFRVKEDRNKGGFLNAVVLNESYVIGMNRNYIFNIISIVLFLFVLAGIIVHAVVRKIHN
jgi:nitrate reductase cytochrome c-type subunit